MVVRAVVSVGRGKSSFLVSDIPCRFLLADRFLCLMWCYARFCFIPRLAPRYIDRNLDIHSTCFPNLNTIDHK